MKILLASSSPRRKELLRLISLEPEIAHPEISEEKIAGEPVERFLERISISKALQIYKKKYYNHLLIAADTIVLLDEEIIGKPANREEAFQMLLKLSNRMHEVWTGLALMHRGHTDFEIAITQVFFKALSSEEINWYLDNEVYLDKAGAYAIQGKAALFVEKVDGCFFNVMGFPLNIFYQMASRLNINLYES